MKTKVVLFALTTLSTATLVFTGGFCKASAKEYGLKVGETAPLIDVKDIQGKKFKLVDQKGPIVLVFYRGGWCPYCNLQLHKIQQELVPKLNELDAKVVAISADKPSEGSKTQKEKKLDMVIISDSDLEITKAYNLLYKVPEDLVKKYKNNYEIDLEAASGKKHHSLPVPAVFVIRGGKIKYAYANENYKVRAQNQDILSAVENSK